ncbi:PH domain-containing protein [Halocatena pleomorpha]|uniref:Uncharacterized protein n=1 Tax=Halocatena pleomorpha TaxID=1785090 RepID=A0A3P3RE18_9EURY|nr:hypothetical protein [Halocatena pleomorpha]RRJ31574.1 hypothetical protein EIK79_07650 [Halocatena pleomorpha]
MKRFEHPYLLALVPAAAGLGGLSVTAAAAGLNTVAGFLILYAMVAVIICSIGYTALLALKYSTETLHQWRIERSGTD